MRSGANAGEAETVGARLLESLATPVAIEGRDLVVPASIGVALASASARPAVDELLRQADVAMYHAKAAGKHRLATYNRQMDPEAIAAPLVPHTRKPRPSPA